MLSRRILLGFVLVLLASGCGALRFNRAWSSFQPDEQAGPMEGRWRGGWSSDWNGHAGGLHCVMTRQDEASYRAWFYATYASLLYFQYETVFRVTGVEGATVRFDGEQDLGKTFGGLYRYEGTVAGDDFRATFRAENGDHGTFEMKRAE